jgi:hypothetical protein
MRNEKTKTVVPRQVEPGDVLRARPMKEPIDHTALIREHIARYPKIIARLAEHERTHPNGLDEPD